MRRMHTSTGRQRPVFHGAPNATDFVNIGQSNFRCPIGFAIITAFACGQVRPHIPYPFPGETCI